MTDVSEESIRSEVKAWLEENWNADLGLVEWRSLLAESGWGTPSWPKQWYGRGLSAKLSSAVLDEIRQFGAIGAADSGVRMLASATLMEHATDYQKDKLLHRIITGEDSWCQLFSEPGSGSDLAGLTTRADLDGDNWIINGQKVWTTSAHHANYGLLLARTDWDVPKHQGISYFVLDVTQPGVEVRPLRQMNGHASFNEVFMTDAVVPANMLVGKLNGGWQVGMTTLSHERRLADGLRPIGGSGAKKAKGKIFSELAAEVKVAQEPYRWYPQRAGRPDLTVSRARDTGALEDPVIRQEVAKALTIHQASQWTARRARQAQRLGRPPGPEGSLGKLAASNVARAAALAHTLTSGADSMLKGEDGPKDGIIAEILLSVPAVSIAGGTDEIQRNIISERVLGLPKEPRTDADGPFKDVPRNIVK
ncbi:MAG: acyl-CoA dehydrogenase family protein [Pseudomonadales bacterium]|nr:acyl-CoA dehydrogenase family protein [Pseudomonadales bacterium]